MQGGNAELERIWGGPGGVMGWLTAVNHKQMGVRFMVTASVFFLFAGIDGVLIRTQLAQPGLNIVSSGTFQSLFTVHGTAMMFFFALPMIEGLTIYLLPLLIGARDLPFPRLNAFSYWCYLFGGLLFFFSVFVEDSLPVLLRDWLVEVTTLEHPLVPDGGWFAYPPLTGPEYASGSSIDFWLLGVTFVEISAILFGIETIVAIFSMRAPGMTLTRMPLFAWSILVVAFMILFAFPPLVVGSILLELERKFGFVFYTDVGGGDPLLWQHLFWFFGHPDVYMLSIPALGMVVMMVVTFSRRPAVGYTWIAVAAIATGLISFGTWVHHMYTTGLPLVGMSFFSTATMMITIPTTIQIFAVIATIWSGSTILRTPMLFVLGFLVMFLIGGITGVMLGVMPFNWQVHDTQFIVAHFHYVLIPGVLFPLLGALYYWLPKITGRMMSEHLGKWNFWVLVIGFNLTFFPLHFLGFFGMTRRQYTYASGQGWDIYNLIAASGAYILGMGVLLFVINFFWSLRSGHPAGDNPWQAGTLEWATSSPPPSYNLPLFPVIRSGNPMWDDPSPLDPQANSIGSPLSLLEEGRRETLHTTAVDAVPIGTIVVAGPSLAPLVSALGLAAFFFGILIDFYLLALTGIVVSSGAVVIWQWPGEETPDVSPQPVNT